MNQLISINGQPLVYIGNNEHFAKSLLQSIAQKRSNKPEIKTTHLVKDAVVVDYKNKETTIFSISKN